MTTWLCKPQAADGPPLAPDERGCGHRWTDKIQPLICPECLNPRTEIVVAEPAAALANITEASDLLQELARTVGGYDNRLLLSADLNVLRVTLRAFCDQARASLDRATSRR